MSAAARRGNDYHLWWHPHNIGRDPEPNLAGLERLLAHLECWDRSAAELDQRERVELGALLGVSLFTVAPQIPDASPEASFTFAAVLVLFSIATTRCWIRVADLATDP